MDNLTNENILAFPGLYVFTGCDYIQAFLNIGKVKSVELVMEGNMFEECSKTNALEDLYLEISARNACVICMPNAVISV